MHAVVNKWGNSLAARIPAAFAAQLHLEGNSPIDMRIEGNSLIITPAKRRRYTLEELVEGITPENRHDEIDAGPAVGKEFW